MTSIPQRSPGRRALAVSLVLALAATAQGCVSTEELYAEYDEHACRVAVETSLTGADGDRREGGGADVTVGANGDDRRIESNRKSGTDDRRGRHRAPAER